ncbi:MAG: SCP2 sterol-binding domain-containing protein [Polyangia bacterium]
MIARPLPEPAPALLRATERFVAAYRARPQLVAEQGDWSPRILLRTPHYGGSVEDGGQAVAVQLAHGQVAGVEPQPQRLEADVTVTAELGVLLDVLELRTSPNEPYLFGELTVDGPEADFLRLDYLVSRLCRP